MNSKECPKCKNCSPDDAASCRTCGAEFPSLRAITPDDVTHEGDRNYNLGRKHAKEELHPAIAALEQLYTSCGHLRLRCEMQAPKIKAFSDWDENSKAMRNAENVLRPPNAELCSASDASASAIGSGHVNKH